MKNVQIKMVYYFDNKVVHINYSLSEKQMVNIDFYDLAKKLRSNEVPANFRYDCFVVVGNEEIQFEEWISENIVLAEDDLWYQEAIN